MQKLSIEELNDKYYSIKTDNIKNVFSFIDYAVESVTNYDTFIRVKYNILYTLDGETHCLIKQIDTNYDKNLLIHSLLKYLYEESNIDTTIEIFSYKYYHTISDVISEILSNFDLVSVLS